MASPVYQSHAQVDSRRSRLALYLGVFALAALIASSVLAELDEVAARQKLAPLDSAQVQVSVDEAEARIAGLRVRAARIRAEIDEEPSVVFPEGLDANSEAARREQELFASNRRAFRENIASVWRQRERAERELLIAMPLLASGAATEIEVLRLKARLVELTAKLTTMRGEYFANLNNDFKKTVSELEPLLKITEGRTGQPRRSVIKIQPNLTLQQ